MAERFTGQRCEDCQGGLIYVKEEKYWECPYCGKIYERELRFNKVQIDGLAGINDLARATLSKVANGDMTGAERDLLECEKIDHNSFGTMIANVSVALFKTFTSRDRQNDTMKLNVLLQKMSREFPEVDDPEEILYDFIESDDIYGLLAVVYGSTKQDERLEMIYNLLDCNNVYNTNVLKYLLSTVLKDGKFEDADTLISHYTNENAKYGLLTVLKLYPSNERKAEHVEFLIKKIDEDTDISAPFENYFATTSDNSDTVVNIFVKAVSRGIVFDMKSVVSQVLAHCDSVESSQRIFNALSNVRLKDDAARSILNWCMLSCTNAEISKIGFKALFDGNSVFELEDEDLEALLASEQDEDVKVEKLTCALSTFKFSTKNMDKLIAYHLIEDRSGYSYRRRIADLLLPRVASVQNSVAERYLLGITTDGEHKFEMFNLILEHIGNVTFSSGLLKAYIKSNVDTPKARDAMIAAMLDRGMTLDPDACNTYLINARELRSDLVLDKILQKNYKAMSTTFDTYLSTVNDSKSYNLKIAAIATRTSFRLSARSFAKYLMLAKEPESRKVENARRYLEATDAGDLRNLLFTFGGGAEKINCNMAQYYFLTSTDDPYVIQEVTNMLSKEKIKLDAPVEDASRGKKIKLHKYVEANATSLGINVVTLAKELL